MNLSILIQAYLEARLSPTEEAQLLAALLDKQGRTAEEEAILTMLQADAPIAPDKTWWSDEGVAEYDALLAQQEAATPKTLKLTPTFGWRWAGGVAAAAVLAFGLWQSAPWWHHSSSAPSTTTTIAQAQPATPPKVAPTAEHQPGTSAVAPAMPSPNASTDRSPAPQHPDRALQHAMQTALLPEAQLLQPLAPNALLAEHGMTTEEREADHRLQADYLHYRMEEMLVAAQIALDYQQYLKAHPFAEAEVHYVEL